MLYVKGILSYLAAACGLKSLNFGAALLAAFVKRDTSRCCRRAQACTKSIMDL